MSRTLPSDLFTYRDGVLHLEGCSLAALAEAHGTPLFVYSGTAIEGAYRTIDAALDFAPHLIAYAVKANGNLAILSRIAKLGGGADIVSGGELERALRAGIAPERILFSGVGKRDDEIELALDRRIRSLHVESAQEVEAIDRIAARRGVEAPISLRINPDVDPQTHPYIATGLSDAKFGLEVAEARAILPTILKSRHLRLEGIACHIGSQLSSPSPLADAVEIVGRFARECLAQGAPLTSLDAGGGWPVPYGNEERPYASAAEYGRAIRDGLARADLLEAGLELLVEPGRSIVGNAGVLVTRVVVTKERTHKRFAIVDAAMTELLRPSLYKAYHGMAKVDEPAEDAEVRAIDIVGPVCETSDFLALDRPMPPIARGELLVIFGAGAYAASMASNYNARPRPAEVWVEGEDARIVRERESVEQLWALERA